MTKVTVISTFTAIPNHGGMVELGDVPLGKTTLHSLKEQIQRATTIDVADQTLWWRGYRLDREDDFIADAVGGETAVVLGAEKNLQVFLTTTTQ
eukprot:CAMPEP_0168779330 /NCGR_PEP_ID=MMETSP0725-20121227/7547_1 /TAXON_ID=265536 /ORGANISM="Amphiprora sp., Strain CCMP467" /LENGTH=93 /DNA_ID=CAMNT_0008829137 /DNA_START=44 /DNA_END=325 /DNA_ORIENTATION=+